MDPAIDSGHTVGSDMSFLHLQMIPAVVSGIIQ